MSMSPEWGSENLLERVQSTLSPSEWASTLSAPPILSSRSDLLRGGLLRRWCNTTGGMRQPPLDHHLVVVHLGGPKHVRRSGDGPTRHADISPGQITVTPAGSAYDWQTQGPVDFAHLYICPKRLDRAVHQAFDREPRSIQLQDRLGLSDGLLERLISTMIEELAAEETPSKPYFETLFDAAVLRVIRVATNASQMTGSARQALAPIKLRRVKAFIEAHLDEDLDLQALADVAGLSRFHFSRAFQQTTGCSPYLFVTRTRIERAKLALTQTNAPLVEVARAHGYNSGAQFSSAFRKITGVCPREWRRKI